VRPATGGATRTRTHVARRISADPTSTALLLAGPTALDLWPGLRRVGEAAGRVLVEAHIPPDSETVATVRALPPRRTPTSYVTKFDWSGPGIPATEGEITLAYTPGSDGPATAAVLDLSTEGLAESGIEQRDLQDMAERFMDNLARAAEGRNRAA
jgi:hypothetical protein